MKYYNFVGEINNKNVNDLIEFINSLTNEEEITINFQSLGGYASSGDILKNIFINEGRIKKVVFNGECASYTFYK